MHQAGTSSSQGRGRRGRAEGRVPARRPSGFTMVEILFSIAVVGTLMALLIVGLRLASNYARRTSEEATVNSLQMGVEQFRQEFGFFPPLVKDQTPLVSQGGRTAPSVYQESVQADYDFLRGESASGPGGDLRFSVYSLPYYVIGALGEATDQTLVDGVEGPGFLTPERDGGFSPTGKRYDPFFSVSKGTQGVFASDLAAGRVELRDRFGTSYRYYRWVRGDANGAVNTLTDLNIPELVGDPSETVELKSAEYAIVAAGANRVFGDLPVEGASTVKDELGLPSSASDTVAKQRARQDNVVRVSR